MTLIRIGQLVINLDRVTSIRDLSTVDAQGQSVPGPIRLGFVGGETCEIVGGADALRTWLGTNAQTLA
jgi:hypothetical protein